MSCSCFVLFTLIFIIFTARSSYASAVLGIVILSVRLSVTRVLCDEMKEHTAEIFTPHERVINLVFWYQQRLVGDVLWSHATPIRLFLFPDSRSGFALNKYGWVFTPLQLRTRKHRKCFCIPVHCWSQPFGKTQKTNKLKNGHRRGLHSIWNRTMF